MLLYWVGLPLLELLEKLMMDLITRGGQDSVLFIIELLSRLPHFVVLQNDRDHHFRMVKMYLLNEEISGGDDKI